MKDDERFTVSSGNVFADLNLDHADIRLAVARANPGQTYEEYKAAVQAAIDNITEPDDE